MKFLCVWVHCHNFCSSNRFKLTGLVVLASPSWLLHALLIQIYLWFIELPDVGSLGWSRVCIWVSCIPPSWFEQHFLFLQQVDICPLRRFLLVHLGILGFRYKAGSYRFIVHLLFIYGNIHIYHRVLIPRSLMLLLKLWPISVLDAGINIRCHHWLSLGPVIILINNFRLFMNFCFLYMGLVTILTEFLKFSI